MPFRSAKKAAASQEPLAVSRYTFCHHPKCDRGSAELFNAAEKVATRMGLSLTLEMTTTLCPGTCADGPFMGIPQLSMFYAGLRRGDMPVIHKETTLGGRLVFPRLYLNPTVVTDSRVVFDWQQRVLVAIEPGYCLLDLISYLFTFNARESCGKCYPCRLGVHRLYSLLSALRQGQAGEPELAELESVARALSDGAYCRFGYKVATPLLLALEYAREDLTGHLEGGCRPEELHL